MIVYIVLIPVCIIAMISLLFKNKKELRPIKVPVNKKPF